MSQTTVRAVHRVNLPTDDHGRITAGELGCEDVHFPPGSMVVLECGAGWWMNASDLQHIHRALSGVGHITVTGSGHSGRRRGGRTDFGLHYGLDAIAAALAGLLQDPDLQDAV